MASRTEADLAKAVKAFEQRFMKRRAIEDKNKLADIEKSLQAKHRQAVKQLASKLNDPEVLQESAAPGGRKQKAVVKKTTAGKKKAPGKQATAKKAVAPKGAMKKKAAKKTTAKKAVVKKKAVAPKRVARKASAKKAAAKAKTAN